VVVVEEDVVVDDADTVEGGKGEEVDGADGTDVGAATVVEIERNGKAVVVVDPVEPHAASTRTRTRLVTTSRFHHNITNHPPPHHYPPPVII
jgi:hypothetical protein